MAITRDLLELMIDGDLSNQAILKRKKSLLSKERSSQNARLPEEKRAEQVYNLFKNKVYLLNRTETYLLEKISGVDSFILNLKLANSKQRNAADQFADQYQYYIKELEKEIAEREAYNRKRFWQKMATWLQNKPTEDLQQNLNFLKQPAEAVDNFLANLQARFVRNLGTEKDFQIYKAKLEANIILHKDLFGKTAQLYSAYILQLEKKIVAAKLENRKWYRVGIFKKRTHPLALAKQVLEYYRNARIDLIHPTTRLLNDLNRVDISSKYSMEQQIQLSENNIQAIDLNMGFFERIKSLWGNSRLKKLAKTIVDKTNRLQDKILEKSLNVPKIAEELQKGRQLMVNLSNKGEAFIQLGAFSQSQYGDHLDRLQNSPFPELFQSDVDNVNRVCRQYLEFENTLESIKLLIAKICRENTGLADGEISNKFTRDINKLESQFKFIADSDLLTGTVSQQFLPICQQVNAIIQRFKVLKNETNIATIIRMFKQIDNDLDVCKEQFSGVHIQYLIDSPLQRELAKLHKIVIQENNSMLEFANKDQVIINIGSLHRQIQAILSMDYFQQTGEFYQKVKSDLEAALGLIQQLGRSNTDDAKVRELLPVLADLLDFSDYKPASGIPDEVFTTQLNQVPAYMQANNPWSNISLGEAALQYKELGVITPRRIGKGYALKTVTENFKRDKLAECFGDLIKCHKQAILTSDQAEVCRNNNVDYIASLEKPQRIRAIHYLLELVKTNRMVLAIDVENFRRTSENFNSQGEESLLIVMGKNIDTVNRQDLKVSALEHARFLQSLINAVQACLEEYDQDFKQNFKPAQVSFARGTDIESEDGSPDFQAMERLAENFRAESLAFKSRQKGFIDLLDLMSPNQRSSEVDVTERCRNLLSELQRELVATNHLYFNFCKTKQAMKFIGGQASYMLKV